jgi:hypothetical protein
MVRHFILLIFLFCVSCAAVPQQPQVQFQTVYKDVYLPVPCDETLPARPQATGNIELMVINLIEYAQVLEVKLGVCITKPNPMLP